MSDLKLMLASGSPRRREILSWLGLPFEVCSVDIDETPHKGEAPDVYVMRLSGQKALKAAEIYPDHYVLGSDTTVADGASILGKPVDEAQAWSMLWKLRGREHQVFTAVSLIEPGVSLRVSRTLSKSNVPMREYSEEEMHAYIDSGDPLDKAGAYGIQNRDFHPAENFSDCFANVMGLPLCHLIKLFASVGIPVDQDIPRLCTQNLQYNCSIFSQILSE